MTNEYYNKCKTKTEMAYEFGVDRKTFRSMLVKFNINLPPGLIYPADQRKI